MTEAQTKRAFISYVKEDQSRVDGLCRILDAAGIPYWRDRDALTPGVTWKAEIRQAIQSGSLVFLACFSDASEQRDSSYMNEEMNLAVEEFRKRPPRRTWLIPIRFAEVTIPEWDLGAGRTLSDIQRVDLFGERHAQEAAALVTTILRVLGVTTVDPASTAASVAEATDEERTVLLRRLTKEMVTDPARRIDLDELIGAEVRRILSALRDAETFPTSLRSGSDEDRVAELASAAANYARLTLPFCASLQIAARWGEPEALGPWTAGLRALSKEADRIQGGYAALLGMRWLPALMATFTAALATSAAGQFQNFKTLLVDATTELRYPEGSVVISESVYPWKPYREAPDVLPSVVARCVLKGEDARTAYDAFRRNRVGNYHTPVEEWLSEVLYPVFEEQFLDRDEYESQFDRAEIYLGLVTQDLVAERQSGHSDRKLPIRSSWFGRSTWRSNFFGSNPVDVIHAEYLQRGSSWLPLTAGLFGSDTARVDRAFEGYSASHEEISRHRF